MENTERVPREGKEDKKVFSRIGLALAVMLVVQIGLVAAIGALVNMLAPAVTETGWYFWVLSYGPLYLVAFPIFLAIMRTVPDGTVPQLRENKRISAGNMLRLVVICIGVVYPLHLLTAALSMLVEMIRGSGLVNPIQEMVLASNPWINILFAVIIAPVMEEFIFRRLMYQKLIPYGGKVYVLFSAFVFALFHGNLYQLVYAFVLGVLFACITYYTGTVRYTTVLHIIINFIGSGVGPLLMAYTGEAVLTAWGVILMVLVVLGLVLGIVWLVQHHREIRFEPGGIAVSKGTALLNGGMIFFYVLFLVILAFSIVGM